MWGSVIIHLYSHCYKILANSKFLPIHAPQLQNPRTATREARMLQQRPRVAKKKKFKMCLPTKQESENSVNAKSLWLKLIFLAFLKADFSYQISPSTKNETTEFLIPRSNSTYNFCEIYLFISGFVSKKCQGSLQRQGLDGKKKFKVMKL